MRSNAPLLTIGIPTWNRERELAECLEEVILQAAAEEDVEILVCDNASPDQTQAYVEDIARGHDFLRYVRHQSNIGSDLNYVEVLRQSRGAYVWILSDDDFITDGSVREVTRILKTYGPSYLTVNYAYCDGKKNLMSHQPNQRYMIKADVAHADINRTFLVRNHWLSFLSCNVYRRDLADFDDILASKENVSSWIQVYMAAQILARGGDGYHSSFTAVLARTGNDRVDSLPFVSNMPHAFMYIFQKFHVGQNVVDAVMRGIRETFLPFHSFLALRARELSASPLITPAHYKIGLLLPKELLVFTRKIYRLFANRPASLHSQADKN
jgi:glycosyltransferase involved in cell wall biosynthesis